MSRITRSLLSIALLAAAGPTLAAQQAMPADPAVATGVLPNGLHYFVRANKEPAHRADLRLIVNAGSILEDSDQAGLAHFVEHMAFNGTAHFPKQELIRFIEGIGMTFGADLNAETSFDDTRYRLTIPTDSAGVLEKGISVLQDWATAVTFDTTEIRKERGVVIEEWRLGQGAGMRMLNKTFPVLLAGSKYADRLPIGTLHSLQTFSPRALTRFYHDWYRPDLMAVVVVGDIDRDSVVSLIRKRFGAIPGRTVRRPRPASAATPPDSTSLAIVTDPEATSTVVALQYLRPTPRHGSVAEFRDALVSQLHDEMLNQRLAEIARRPDAPFIGASVGEEAVVRPLESYAIGASVSGGAVQRALDGSLAEVERVRQFGFVAPEFDRVQRNLRKAYDDAFDGRNNLPSGAFADDLAEHFLTGSNYSDIGQARALMDSLLRGITLAEVNQAAQRWLSVRRRVVTVTAPARLADSLPTLAALRATVDSAQQVTAYVEHLSEDPLVPTPPAQAAIVSEQIDSANGVTRWTLANGVHVLLKPTDFKADEVLFSGSSPGGLSREPDSLVFASRFVGAAISTGGLGAFSEIDLEKKLAGHQAWVGPAINGYQESVRGGAAPADLLQLFQLTWLLFTAPRVDSAAFGVMQANGVTQLRQHEADPSGPYRDTLSVTLGRHHRWTEPLTADRAAKVTIGQVYDLFRNRYADAADFTFVLVGHFNIDSVRPLVRSYLGTLPSIHRDNSARDVGLDTPAGVEIREVHRGIAAKSQTALVYSGEFAWSRQERGLLDAVATVLEDRLRKALREELGGTYSVSVSGQPTLVPRPRYRVSIEYGSAPERAGELATRTSRIVDSLRADGPTAEELSDWKESLRRQHQEALRENDYWVNVLSSSVAQGESVGEILDLERWLAPVTTADVRLAAGRFLNPERYVRVTWLPADSSSHSTR